MDLGNNTFSGTLPLSFAEMTTIQVLTLDNNQLVGAIPSELGLLTQLQNLELHGNSFTGTMPAEVCQLRSAGSLSTLTADCRGDTFECDCCTRCL